MVSSSGWVYCNMKYPRLASYARSGLTPACKMRSTCPKTLRSVLIRLISGEVLDLRLRVAGSAKDSREGTVVIEIAAFTTGAATRTRKNTIAWAAFQGISFFSEGPSEQGLKAK